MRWVERVGGEMEAWSNQARAAWPACNVDIQNELMSGYAFDLALLSWIVLSGVRVGDRCWSEFGVFWCRLEHQRGEDELEITAILDASRADQ